MRDELPSNSAYYNEPSVVNLDNARGIGTHWVAYRKRGNEVIYFVSFGDLQPLFDLMYYFNVPEIKYNYKRFQDFDTYWCGHLCIKFF